MLDAVIFIPTNECNMKCEYCLHHIADGYKRNPITKMNKETLERIMGEIKDKLNICSIQFSGGEPMLAQDILKHFLSTYKKYRVRIFTNGTIIPDSELLWLMKTYPELEVNLSIDSIETIPELYQVLIDNNIKVCASAVIDETTIEKNIETFNFLRSLDLVRYTISPNYLSQYSKELLDFYQELGTKIGQNIVSQYHENHVLLGSYYELTHYFGVIHNNIFGYDLSENEHPKVWRFAPDGNYVPSIVHAGIDPSVENFENLFDLILDMSAKFHNAPREFLKDPKSVHQFYHKTSPSTFYFGHMIKNICNELETNLSMGEISDLFQIPFYYSD